MDTIRDFVAYICDILGIKPVKIVSVSQNKMNAISPGHDTLAAYDLNNDCIYLLRRKKYEMIHYYYISHELRHVWQHYTDHEKYYSSYYDNLDEHMYDVNPAEIDANAFAFIAMAIAFGQVSERVYSTDPIAQQLYNNRVKELEKEFGIIIKKDS